MPAAMPGGTLAPTIVMANVGEGVDRQDHGTSAANTRGFRMWTWGISTALVAMAAAGALAYGVEWVAELVDRIDLPGLPFDDDVAPPPR